MFSHRLLSILISYKKCPFFCLYRSHLTFSQFLCCMPEVCLSFFGFNFPPLFFLVFHFHNFLSTFHTLLYIFFCFTIFIFSTFRTVHLNSFKRFPASTSIQIFLSVFESYVLYPRSQRMVCKAVTQRDSFYVSFPFTQNH